MSVSFHFFFFFFRFSRRTAAYEAYLPLFTFIYLFHFCVYVCMMYAINEEIYYSRYTYSTDSEIAYNNVRIVSQIFRQQNNFFVIFLSLFRLRDT